MRNFALTLIPLLLTAPLPAEKKPTNPKPAIDTHKLDANGQPTLPPPTEAEAAAQKKSDQETAARIAGELFALPKNQRMAALIKLPIPDRIAFTTYLAAGGALEAQKNLL